MKTTLYSVYLMALNGRFALPSEETNERYLLAHYFGRNIATQAPTRARPRGRGGLAMWRIVYVDNPSGSEPLPNGLRNDDGFACFFVAPVFWPGQEQRYLEECALLRKRAEIMCAALNREAV